MSKKIELNESTKIFMWISRVPSEDHHKDARKDRIHNTGNWIFQHPQYRKWEEMNQGILWLHGIRKCFQKRLRGYSIESLSIAWN